MPFATPLSDFRIHWEREERCRRFLWPKIERIIVLDQGLTWNDPPQRDGPARILEIRIPAGFRSDGASVPRPLRGLVPGWRATTRPAVLHDWLYRTADVSRSEADRIFRDALRDDRVSVLGAALMWVGVRVGGWAAYRG